MPDDPKTIEPPPMTPPAGADQPASDTSTDWDEWMERHGGKPRPLPDVADEKGKIEP
jgi:hypothetical protein